jgi:hypothetical protein
MFLRLIQLIRSTALNARTTTNCHQTELNAGLSFQTAEHMSPWTRHASSATQVSKQLTTLSLVCQSLRTVWSTKQPLVSPWETSARFAEKPSKCPTTGTVVHHSVLLTPSFAHHWTSALSHHSVAQLMTDVENASLSSQATPSAQSVTSVHQFHQLVQTVTTTVVTASVSLQRLNVRKLEDVLTQFVHLPTRDGMLRSVNVSVQTLAILFKELMPIANALALKPQPVEDTNSSMLNCADVNALVQEHANAVKCGATLLVTALLTQELFAPHHSINSTPTDAIVFARLNNNACVEHQLSMLHAHALHCRMLNHQRSSIQLLVLKDVPMLHHALVASSGVTIHAHVFRTQLLDVCPIFTDSTTMHATVFVSTRLNANAVLKQWMPLADAHHSTLALLLKCSIRLLANALVHQLKHVDVDSSSVLRLALALPIQLPDVFQTFTSSTLRHATVNACNNLNAFAEQLSTIKHVLVQLWELALPLSSLTQQHVNADAQQLLLADVDSCSIQTVVHVLPIQLPDVSHQSTLSTLKDVTVSAELNNNAFAVPLLTMPLVDAQHSHHAHKAKPTIPLLVNADVLPLLHAVAVWFGTQLNVNVLLIQVPDASQTCTDSTEPDVTVFVLLNNNACAEHQLWMPLADAHHSNHAQPHKHSIQTLVLADAHQLNNAVVDSCLIQTDAHVLLIQMPDVCPTFTDSIPPDVTVFVWTLQTAFAVPHSAMPLAHAQLCQPVKDLKCLITTHVNADAQQLKLADVDSSLTPTLAHVPQTLMQDAHQTFTSSTPKCATVSAELNNNAFAVPLPTMPLADAQLHQVVLLHKCSTQLLVNADAQLLLHAVAVSSSALNHAHVLLTQMPDAHQLSMHTTMPFAIADVEFNQIAFAVPLLWMPLAHALHSHHAQLLKCSIKPLADADAHQFNSAVADSCSMLTHAHAYLIQLPDVFQISTDSTQLDVTVSVALLQTAFAEQHSVTQHAHVQLFKHVQALKCLITTHVNADAQPLKLAVADSSSTPTLAHVHQTQMPDAHQHSTSTTLKCAIVSAEPNNNAFAVPLPTMPLADVQLNKLAMLHKCLIQLLANADAQLSHHAVAVSFSALKHAHVLLTKVPDVCHLFTITIPVFAIADAEFNHNAFAEQLQSTQHVNALHSQLVLHHKCSNKPLADADAHQSNNAVADSSSTLTHAHACQTQLPDVCLPFTDSTPPDVTVFVLQLQTAFAEQHSATPLALVLLSKHVQALKCLTPTVVNADVHPLKLAVADSSSTPTLAHVPLIQLPDVSQHSTSTTLKCATVSAELNNNAFAEQHHWMPLADAQLNQAVKPHKSMTQLLANADAQLLLHAVAVSSSTLNHVHVLLTKVPDVCHHFMLSIPVFAIADAEFNLNALVVPLLSTQHVNALHSQLVLHLKCSIKPLADADAHQSNNAVADSSSILLHVLAYLTQLPDVCPTSTDSTLPDVTVSVWTPQLAFVQQPSTMQPVLVQPFQTAHLLRSWTHKHVNADAQQLKHAVADSSSALNHVHALPIQLPDVSQQTTSSTLKDVTVSAEPNNNAFAVPLQSTPPADAQLFKLAMLHKCSIQLLANADAHQWHHAVVDSSSTLNHALVLPIQMPDVCHQSMLSTTVFAIADAEFNLNALVVPLLSMPLANAHRSHHAQPHKSSTNQLADADAHQFNNAVADSSSTTCHAHACLIQMPDVCQTSTDSTLPDVSVCASTHNNVSAPLNQWMLHALALLCQLVKALRSSTTPNVNADAHQFNNAVVDSSSTLNHAHVLPIQLPDVCPTFTSSTPKHVTVNACNNNNACVVQLLTMPPVVVQLSQHAHKVKDSIAHLADVFVLQSSHAVVEQSSIQTLVNVLPIQLLDVCPTSTDSTTTDATVCVSIKLLVCAEHLLSMPPALVQHSPTAQPHKPSTHQHAHAVAVLLNNAVVDSSSALSHVLALLTQVSPAHLAKDTTPTLADVSVLPLLNAHAEQPSNRPLAHALKDQLLHALIACSTVRPWDTTTQPDHQMFQVVSDSQPTVVHGSSHLVQMDSQSSDGVLPMLLNALVVTSSKTASSTTSTQTQPVPLSTHSFVVSATSCTTELLRIADAMSTDHSPSHSSAVNSVSVLLVPVHQLKDQKVPSMVTFAESNPPDCSNSPPCPSHHLHHQDSSLSGSSRDTSSAEASSTPSHSPSSQPPQTWTPSSTSSRLLLIPPWEPSLVSRSDQAPSTSQPMTSVSESCTQKVLSPPTTSSRQSVTSLMHSTWTPTSSLLEEPSHLTHAEFTPEATIKTKLNSDWFDSR